MQQKSAGQPRAPCDCVSPAGSLPDRLQQFSHLKGYFIEELRSSCHFDERSEEKSLSRWLAKGLIRDFSLLRRSTPVLPLQACPEQREGMLRKAQPKSLPIGEQRRRNDI